MSEGKKLFFVVKICSSRAKLYSVLRLSSIPRNTSLKYWAICTLTYCKNTHQTKATVRGLRILTEQPLKLFFAKKCGFIFKKNA